MTISILKELDKTLDAVHHYCNKKEFYKEQRALCSFHISVIYDNQIQEIVRNKPSIDKKLHH